MDETVTGTEPITEHDVFVVEPGGSIVAGTSEHFQPFPEQGSRQVMVLLTIGENRYHCSLLDSFRLTDKHYAVLFPLGMSRGSAEETGASQPLILELCWHCAGYPDCQTRQCPDCSLKFRELENLEFQLVAQHFKDRKASSSSAQHYIALQRGFYTGNIEDFQCCHQCNTLFQRSRCPNCSNTATKRERVCAIVSTTSPEKELLEFLEQAQDLFHKMISGETVAVSIGENAPAFLLDSLSNGTEDVHISALLALRLCGYEVWGSGTEPSYHFYRRPGSLRFEKTCPRDA